MFNTPKLLRVVPNEQWQLVLEFASQGFRLFDASIARVDKGWSEFAYPNKLKNLTFTEREVLWPLGRSLSARYLLSKSKPLTAAALENQVLRLGYKNQAPTPTHPTHHVYGIHLYPFRREPFEIGESIGGGHAEMGGSQSYDLSALLASTDWKTQFELSGCSWAIPLVQQSANESALLVTLITETCRREGAAGA